MGGTTTSSSLAFGSSNTAGNWIAVCVRAGGSSTQVFTVRDSNNNSYVKAVQLSVTVDAPNGDTLAIYYAENVKGGANTVTVSDTITGTLRFAILEYAGVATTNSLDGVAAAQGTSAATTSGTFITTANGDLLLGAIVSANESTFVAGSGYTISDAVPAAPNMKLIAESQIQATAGTAAASASLSASDAWGTALAAFKAGSSGPSPPDTTPPTAPTGLTATPGPNQIIVSWTASTDIVGVTGYRMERCQGSG